MMEKFKIDSPILEAMNWRYATKKMDDSTIAASSLNSILESIRLSASSMGFQPYRVMVVTDPELKNRLQPAAYGQQQISGCSHLLVFAVIDQIGFSHVQQTVDLMAAVRGIQVESLNGYKAMLEQAVTNRTQEGLFHWASKQAYIALGTGMVAAAMEKVDATPMEGFVPESFDEILGLKEYGLKSVVLLALGKRNESLDTNANKKKVRVPSTTFFIWK